MVEEVMLPDSDSPESIGVDPLDSILPDSDTIFPDSEDITVKHEKIGGVGSEATDIPPVSSNSTSVSTAPMTAVFTDAANELNIKAEPGLVSIKKEATFEITPLSSQAEDSKEKENTEQEKDPSIATKETEVEGEDEEEGKEKESNSQVVEKDEEIGKSFSTFSEVLDDISNSAVTERKGEKSKTEVNRDAAEPEPEADTEADTGYEDQSDIMTEVNGEATEEEKEEEGSREGQEGGDNPPEELGETEDTADIDAEGEFNGEREEGEEFSELFSDYPGMEESWQTNDEALDLGPLDIQGNFQDWLGDEECLEDAPGMEVRDLREQSEEGIDDPLFDTEDGDLDKEDDIGELDPDMNEEEGQEEEPGGLDVDEESGLSEMTDREEGEDGIKDNLNEDCDENLQTEQLEQTAEDAQRAENDDSEVSPRLSTESFTMFNISRIRGTPFFEEGMSRGRRDIYLFLCYSNVTKNM